MTQPRLFDKLRAPIIAAPMFLISSPDLVIAQCKAGIIGSFPALNARPALVLDQWLQTITDALDRHNQANPDHPAAPFAVNQIVHRSNQRLWQDVELCVKHKVPIIITSLGAKPELNDAIHQYDGLVLHDVINNRFATKAIEKGADGLIAVAAGAGGHAGTLSPFALVQEIRQWFAGPLILSGAIATGSAVLAAQAMGADLAYIGSPFIATSEASATIDYKQMIVESSATDIIYSNLFTGVHGNYLKPSIIAQGLDPDNLPEGNMATMSFDPAEKKDSRPWKDILGSGQGIGVVKEIIPAAQRIAELIDQYQSARDRMVQLTSG